MALNSGGVHTTCLLLFSTSDFSFLMSFYGDYLLILVINKNKIFIFNQKTNNYWETDSFSEFLVSLIKEFENRLKEFQG